MRWILTMLLCVALPATGISSGAMRFDGSDDFIDLGDVGDGVYEQTISAWVYSNVNNDYKYIISKYDGTSGAGKSFYLRPQNSGKLYWIVYTGTTPSHQAIETDNIVITNENWHHVVVTYDSSPLTQKIYVDGVEVPSSVSSSAEL